MIMNFARLGLALVLSVSFSAHASFHLWKVNEIYSNADGSVQYVELLALAGGQQFIAGHRITSSQGSQTKSFTFPTNLPGDSAPSAGGGIYGTGMEVDYKSMLIGTQGFAALNLVAPDFIVPNGFLFTTNGTINFAEASAIVSYASLPTTGGLSLNVNGASMTNGLNTPTNFAGVTGFIPASAAAGPLDYSDMWWVGESENGWGMSIQQHGNIQFNAIYVYDAAGKPTWYVMPTGIWNANFTTYSGLIYQPTSAPLNSYNKDNFVVGTSPGSVTLTFTSSSTATLQYTINNISGTKTLKLQDFTGGSAPMVVSDIWWAGATQDGWGINFVQHGGIVFGVWYTYGLDGKPIWYVLPNGTWSGNTYSGALYSTTGSVWLGANYNPALLTPKEVGTLSFVFTNSSNATMNYSFSDGPFAGTTQSKNISRNSF